jgi:hypothetical protein
VNERRFRPRHLWVLATALALVAAACAGTSNDGSGGNATTSTASPTSTQSGTDEGSSTSSTPSQGDSSNLTFSISEGWNVVSLGPGVKPAIAIDPSGDVGVTWLLEKIGEGFVAYASSSADWDVETIREGYFYGPIGLAYQPDGTPNIIIHDHQADDFDPQLGDLVRLFRDGSTWVEDVARDPGHDGWDSTVVIGDDGVIHAAGVDPAQFGSTDGVEYYRNAGTGWEVTQIGSGPIPYQYNVALALDAAGSPSLTYYDDANQDLIFAQLVDGSWNLEKAAEEGDVGKYSSLAIGPDGQPAVTFFRQTGATSGEIVYATRGDGGWEQETIGQLDAFSELNARRNSSLAFDSQGQPNVAFSDTEGAWYAVRGDSGWEIQQILEADLPLGQLISLALSEDDTPNIALYEVTQQQPLDGSVAYLTTG